MVDPLKPRRQVEVPEIAYQEAIEIDPAGAAFIVVDMQNDFAHPRGSLPVPAAGETISKIADLLKRARAAGVRIVYTQDTHFEGDPEWTIWPEHCRQGSWGWEIIEELRPQEGELVCRKNRYDAFYGTWLDHFLSRVWDVRHLVVVGTVANICVLHTAASAGLRWFQIVVPADAVSALTDFDQMCALRQISWLYGGLLTRYSEDISFGSREKT